MGDLNGDGRDDGIAFVRNSQPGDPQGNVYVALSTTNDYLPPQLYLPFVNRS